MIYPIKTAPVFKQYLWGGDNLMKKFDKPVPDGFAAESWEVSCHRDGLSLVANGEYKDQVLRDVIFANSEAMLGKSDTETFPLLLKLLDANDKLSVQVHPDNEFAAKYEDGELGKTEMWYVVDAKPDAKLIYGLKEGTTPQAFEKAIQNGTLEELLNYVPVKKGDSFFIPSGTVHAICEGLVIAEIQQSSNTTYRVYDYNRTDKDGNKRPLHVEKAILATDYNAGTGSNLPKEVVSVDGGTYQIIAECEYFTVIKYSCEKAMTVSKTNQFEMLICTDGNGSIGYDGIDYEFKAGDSFFIPAAISDYIIKGKCEILRSHE